MLQKMLVFWETNLISRKCMFKNIENRFFFFPDYSFYLKKKKWSSLVVQWIKDLVLSLLWLRLLLWHRFNPWPRNFHMPWMHPKRKKSSCMVVVYTLPDSSSICSPRRTKLDFFFFFWCWWRNKSVFNYFCWLSAYWLTFMCIYLYLWFYFLILIY